VLSSLPRHHNSLLAKCGCKKHDGRSRRPHKHVHSSLRCNQGAQLDGIVPLALSSARLDTRSAPSKESRQARANGAATWSSATTCETKLAAGAWSSTSASRMMLKTRLRRDEGFGGSSHPQHNGRLKRPQDNDAPLHIAAERKINSFSQQDPDNQNISFLPTQPIGLVPFQARGILPVVEEQCRTRGGQSGGVVDQPQYRRLWHSSRPSARSFTRSPSSPRPCSHNVPFPRVH
jgi:hypothetical protein